MSLLIISRGSKIWQGGNNHLANIANVKEGSVQHHAREGNICGHGVWARLRPLKSFGVFIG